MFFSTFKACSLFWIWLLSFWQVTTIFDGKWVILTAESVVFTPCPPAPVERYTSIFKSFSSISIVVSCSISGVTSTDANDVCLLLLESNGDNLTNLCTPFSFFKYP